MSAAELFAEWQRALDLENQQLVEEGEEPLTVAVFVRCKAQDASFERTQAERLRVARWHDTFNASLTGLRASGIGSRSGDLEAWVARSRELNKVASADANGAHGMLPPRSKP